MIFACDYVRTQTSASRNGTGATTAGVPVVDAAQTLKNNESHKTLRKKIRDAATIERRRTSIKRRRIMKELKKIAWGLVVIAIGIAPTCLFFLCFNERMEADVIDFLGLHSRECTLRTRFSYAVGDGDVHKAEKIFGELERWERAYNTRRDEEYAKQYRLWQEGKAPRPCPKRQSCATPYMGARLCEMKGEWENALSYLEQTLKLTVAPSERVDGYRGEDARPAVARLRYKLGDKAQAFKDYCEIAPYEISDSPEASARAKRLLCQEGEAAASPSALSPPFETYADFLRFMEVQYLKLGRPEEYADAMNAYRALTSVARR